MSEFKFSCSKCGQKMYGDDQYAGTQINCPVCQNEIVVPQGIQAVANAPVKVSVSVHKSPSSAAVAPPPPPISPRPAYVPKDYGSEKSKTKMMVLIGVLCLVVLCPIILFFAFPDQVHALETKFGFADKKVEPDADGGQLGHIAELYSVLDATDPEKGYAEYQREKAKMEAAEKAAEKAEKDAELAEANAPLGEVVWNLEPSEDIIPTGKPHGSIANSNFVADVVRMDKQNNQYLLTFRQGTNAVADCEMLVYLQLKPDEQIAGKSWTISAKQKSGGPRVVKKWKANPKFAPLQKIYGGGYAMRLEFGESIKGKIPGTIYVALPDAEKSFVGGRFRVDDFRKRLSLDDLEL